MCKQNEGVTVEVLVNVVVNESVQEFEKEQFSALEPLVNKKEEELEEKMGKMDLNKNSKKAEDKILKCSTCGDFATFATAADQRVHFKSDWHVENVKRKSKNVPLVSEQEFLFNKDYS